VPANVQFNQVQIHDRMHAAIESIIGSQQYKVWFRNSSRIEYADGVVKVGVPNLFISGYIEDHFVDAVHQAAQHVFGQPMQVAFSIDPVLFRNLRKSQLNSQADFIGKQSERALKDDGGNGTTYQPQSRTLRGRLDDFVVGSNNRLAYSIARNLVEGTMLDTSPVFFYSSCGLGKTHLLQGIANALSKSKPDVRWKYASGEEFTNEFLYALRERKLDAFRHRYRDVDVLLLDDMQFIANKKATQEEFFHTFEAISGASKQIVLASDSHPKLIGDLTDSLVSRIVAGMVVRIERPDQETRVEILRQRVAKTSHQVPDAVLEYIASRINANVRELEGCLLKLLAYGSLTKSPITTDLARQALDEHLTQTDKILTVSDIEQSVATYFGITPADLHTSKKSRTIALARNVAMFLARKHTSLSFPEIARLMGNKNHTTVLLACRRIKNYLEENADVTWQTGAGPQTRSLHAIIECQEEHLRVGGKDAALSADASESTENAVAAPTEPVPKVPSVA